MQTDKFENMIVNYLKRKKITLIANCGVGDYKYFKDDKENEYYMSCGLIQNPDDELKEKRFNMVNRK